MARKKQLTGWKLAKKRCRLDRNDVAMAKELRLRPETLISQIPDRRQKSPLPVREWIRIVYRERFGFLPGEPMVVEHLTPEEEARRFEEQMYWDDYWDRNSDDDAAKPRAKPAHTETVDTATDLSWLVERESDEDVPF